MPLPRIEIEPALPPHALVPWIDAAGVCALDADPPGGWRSPPLRRHGRSRAYGLSSLALEPDEIFTGGRSALAEALRWLAPVPDRPPRAASLTGYLRFELGESYEPLRTQASMEPRATAPDVIWLAGHTAQYYYCRSTRTGWVEGESQPRVRELADRVRAATAAAKSLHREYVHRPDAAGPIGHGEHEALEHARAVRRILHWIREGDVYQVNLARCIRTRPIDSGQARRGYAGLQHRHPAPFAAFVDTGTLQILSNSPERFLHVAGREIETRPIKGTRPRGHTPAQDRALLTELQASAKDRAEHVMIVDLERNDLGRICEVGSISVEVLAAPVSLPTVHHLESSVRGRLRAGTDLDSILAATFPGGSISGAPKLRARQIIHALEPAPRGIYTGSILCMDAAGDWDSSIAIRTAVSTREYLSLHVGGGIVADSTPAQEFAETCDKARAFCELLGARAGSVLRAV